MTVFFTNISWCRNYDRAPRNWNTNIELVGNCPDGDSNIFDEVRFLRENDRTLCEISGSCCYGTTKFR